MLNLDHNEDKRPMKHMFILSHGQLIAAAAYLAITTLFTVLFLADVLYILNE